MVRFPCENYLKYLLIGGKARWSYADIQRHMEGLHYPPPETEYLEQLAANIHSTRPKPYLIGGKAPKVWMQDHGLWAIYHDTHTFKQATELLESTEYRPAMEAFIISGVSREHTVLYIKELFGLEILPVVFDVYEHAYWDRRLLTTDEWLAFLKIYPGGRGLNTCFMADPRYTLHYLGVDIKDLDMRGMIQHVAQDAYFRIQELRGAPASKVSRAVSDYAEILLSANREMGGATTLSQLLEQVHALGLELQKKAISELSDTRIEEATILDGTVIAGELVEKKKK